MSFKQEPIIVEREIGGLPLKLESGWIAKQASGSTLVRYGDNVVFDAVVLGEPRNADQDFFPMTVDYRERTSAIGRYPGGFLKREGRPTNKETLTMWLTDRPIRPMFPDDYKAEVLIQGMVYSADGEIDTDVLNIIGASAALTLSDAPFLGPIGAVRIGLLDDEFIPFPTHEEREKGDLDLVVAGTKDSITMVECAANEVPEEQMVEALEYAHEIIQEICEMQAELAEKMGVKATPPAEKPELPGEVQKLVERTKEWEPKLIEALSVRDKHARKAAVKAVKKEAAGELVGSDEEIDSLKELNAFNLRKKSVGAALDKMVKATMRKLILDKEQRVDGRGLRDVRDIDIELGLLPRTHGSALFTRGETQLLVVVTLGTKDDEQLIEGLKDPEYERFMLHYNFPPFSVNEVKRIMGPGRREIGHGTLAQRALSSLVPSFEEFPYTIRITADTMESNGSSSMATVCGGSLAMYQAGVPMKNHVAGIAMGLVSDGKTFKVLSDILGDEDQIGDMDFKVTGTEDGITALQMDVKLEEGLKKEVMSDALNQAREGRLHILEKMREAISKPGKQSKFAPKVRMIEINRELIGKVIGAGGKMIRSIEETTGSKLDIEETGNVRIYGPSEDAVEQALAFVRSITEEPEVGRIYNGRVVSTKDFGAFIEIMPGTEGMCHISELSGDYVERVSDIVSVGDELEVKVIMIDDSGRVKLSHRAVLAERGGEEYTPNLPGSGGGGGGGNGRGGGGGGRSGGGGGRGERRGGGGGGGGGSRGRGGEGGGGGGRDREGGGGGGREREGGGGGGGRERDRESDDRGSRPRRRRRGRSSAVSGDSGGDGDGSRD